MLSVIGVLLMVALAMIGVFALCAYRLAIRHATELLIQDNYLMNHDRRVDHSVLRLGAVK